MNDLDTLVATAQADFAAAQQAAELENAKARYLNGTLSSMPRSTPVKAFGASVRCLMN